nr:probable disease resistance protein At4g19520 [Ziziphus jujuba var. spinosa]
MTHLPSSIFHVEKLQTLSCCNEVAKSTLRENIMNPTSVKCFLPRRFCSFKELDLSDCKLTDEAFPEYFGGLVSLEKLNLSRNSFSVLPRSIKKLSNLTHLNLEHCENLTHLGPDLPSTLENVILNYCTSLNSLDSLQKPCHLRCVDCFKLVQKQGSKTTVLASLQRYFQEPTNGSRDFDIILPGSEIPDWFKTKSSMPSSIRIEIDANWYKNGKWIGFAMAVCLHANSSACDNFKYIVRCCSKVAKRCRIMHSIGRIKSRSSDHLWLFFLHRDSIQSEWLHETRGNLEFSVSAYNGNAEDESYCGPCGLRLVHDNDIEELNQLSKNNFTETDTHQEDLHSPPSNRVDNMINPTVGKGVLPGHDPSSLTKLDLSSRNLTDEPFPEDFGCLVSLEDLNLSRNPFNVLPPSIKNLSKLKYLNLEYCTSLKCLGPEVPSSVETILVNYCTSLNSFLDPSNPCHLRCSAFCVDCSELVKRQDSTMTALTSLKRYLQVSLPLSLSLLLYYHRHATNVGLRWVPKKGSA